MSPNLWREKNYKNWVFLLWFYYKVFFSIFRSNKTLTTETVIILLWQQTFKKLNYNLQSIWNYITNIQMYIFSVSINKQLKYHSSSQFEQRSTSCKWIENSLVFTLKCSPHWIQIYHKSHSLWYQLVKITSFQ